MPLSKLAEPLKIYPQELENVRVTDKKAAQDDEAVQEAVKAVAEALGDTGRILVRESGTEPLVRVMVEALDHDICQKYVSQVVKTIKIRRLRELLHQIHYNTSANLTVPEIVILDCSHGLITKTSDGSQRPTVCS